MEKFCKFELCEYMDMYPTTKVVPFEGTTESEIVAKAKAWAKEMTSLYSGGPTIFIKLMTAEEAKEHIDSVIEYEKQNPKRDSEEFIKSVMSVYYRCY